MEELGWILLGIFLVVIGIFIYFLPTFIAFDRNHENKGWIILLNIVIGGTGLGWIAVLLWAALGEKKKY